MPVRIRIALLVCAVLATAAAASAQTLTLRPLRERPVVLTPGQSPLLNAASAKAGHRRLVTVAVGGAPQGGALDEGTHTMYVPNSNDNTVSVVDLARCSAVDASGCAQHAPVIPVGTLPLGVAVDAATHTLFVADALDNAVAVIDTGHCRAGDTSRCVPAAIVTVGTFDNALIVDPDTHMVYVTNQGSTPPIVSVIDGNACTGAHPAGCATQPLTSVRVGGGVSGIGVNAVTDTIYAANTGLDPNGNPVPDGNTVSLINGARCLPAQPSGCAAVGLVHVGTAPAVVVADPLTNTIYVGNTYDGTVHEGTVSVIDGTTCDGADPSGCAAQSPPEVTVGADPIGLAVDDALRAAFVTNAGDDTISVLDTAACHAGHLIGCAGRPPTVAVAGGPTWALVDPPRHTVYVVNQVTNDVAVLDAAGCSTGHLSGCRHPVAVTPAGPFPNAAGVDLRYHTAYFGDANAFSTPFSVSMVNTATCNARHLGRCPSRPLSAAAVGAPAFFDINEHTNTVYLGSDAAVEVLPAATCNAMTIIGCDHPGLIPVGGDVVVVDPSTDTIYSANHHDNLSGFVSVIDGRHCKAGDMSGCAFQTLATTPSVTIGNAPGGLALDPATHTLYAVNIADHTVSVIDTTHCHAGDTSDCAAQTPATVTVPNVQGPFAITLDHATDTVYVTDSFSFSPGAVSIIDTRHCRADDTSQCASQVPVAVATPTGGGTMVRVDPDTDLVYVSDGNDSSVAVIDGSRCNALNQVHCRPIRIIPVGSEPSDLALDPVHQTGYAPNFLEGDASVFAMGR